jgi:hypothetical protein
MDIFVTTLLTFLVVYYLVYQVCYFLFSESVQFIKNEVRYNYEQIRNETDYVSSDELINKINELRTMLENTNLEFENQKVLLQQLQNQLNSLN